MKFINLKNKMINKSFIKKLSTFTAITAVMCLGFFAFINFINPSNVKKISAASGYEYFYTSSEGLKYSDFDIVTDRFGNKAIYDITVDGVNLHAYVVKFHIYHKNDSEGMFKTGYVNSSSRFGVYTPNEEYFLLFTTNELTSYTSNYKTFDTIRTYNTTTKTYDYIPESDLATSHVYSINTSTYAAIDASITDADNITPSSVSSAALTSLKNWNSVSLVDSDGETATKSVSPWLYSLTSDQINKISVGVIDKTITSVNPKLFFAGLPKLQYVRFDINGTTKKDLTSLEGTFANSGIRYLDFTNVNTNAIKNYTNAFCNCTRLEEVDLSKLANTTNNQVSGLANMFYGCSRLKKIDFSSWPYKAGGYGSLEGLVDKCSELQYLDLSPFDFNAASGKTDLLGCTKIKTVFMPNSIDREGLINAYGSSIVLKGGETPYTADGTSIKIKNPATGSASTSITELVSKGYPDSTNSGKTVTYYQKNSNNVAPAKLALGDIVILGKPNDNNLNEKYRWRVVAFYDLDGDSTTGTSGKEAPLLMLDDWYSVSVGGNKQVAKAEFDSRVINAYDPSDFVNTHCDGRSDANGPYDAGDYSPNRYATSDIRKFLNSTAKSGLTNFEDSYTPDGPNSASSKGFLANFTEDEIRSIRTMPIKTISGDAQIQQEMYSGGTFPSKPTPLDNLLGVDTIEYDDVNRLFSAYNGEEYLAYKCETIYGQTTATANTFGKSATVKTVEESALGDGYYEITYDKVFLPSLLDMRTIYMNSNNYMYSLIKSPLTKSNYWRGNYYKELAMKNSNDPNSYDQNHIRSFWLRDAGSATTIGTFVYNLSGNNIFSNDMDNQGIYASPENYYSVKMKEVGMAPEDGYGNGFTKSWHIYSPNVEKNKPGYEVILSSTATTPNIQRLQTGVVPCCYLNDDVQLSYSGKDNAYFISTYSQAEKEFAKPITLENKWQGITKNNQLKPGVYVENPDGATITQVGYQISLKSDFSDVLCSYAKTDIDNPTSSFRIIFDTKDSEEVSSKLRAGIKYYIRSFVRSGIEMSDGTMAYSTIEGCPYSITPGRPIIFTKMGDDGATTLTDENGGATGLKVKYRVLSLMGSTPKESKLLLSAIGNISKNDRTKTMKGSNFHGGTLNSWSFWFNRPWNLFESKYFNEFTLFDVIPTYDQGLVMRGVEEIQITPSDESTDENPKICEATFNGPVQAGGRYLSWILSVYEPNATIKRIAGENYQASAYTDLSYDATKDYQLTSYMYYHYNNWPLKVKADARTKVSKEITDNIITSFFKSNISTTFSNNINATTNLYTWLKNHEGLNYWEYEVNMLYPLADANGYSMGQFGILKDSLEWHTYDKFGELGPALPDNKLLNSYGEVKYALKAKVSETKFKDLSGSAYYEYYFGDIPANYFKSWGGKDFGQVITNEPFHATDTISNGDTIDIIIWFPRMGPTFSVGFTVNAREQYYPRNEATVETDKYGMPCRWDISKEHDGSVCACVFRRITNNAYYEGNYYYDDYYNKKWSGTLSDTEDILVIYQGNLTGTGEKAEFTHYISGDEILPLDGESTSLDGVSISDFGKDEDAWRYDAGGKTGNVAPWTLYLDEEKLAKIKKVVVTDVAFTDWSGTFAGLPSITNGTNDKSAKYYDKMSDVIIDPDPTTTEISPKFQRIATNVTGLFAGDTNLNSVSLAKLNLNSITDSTKVKNIFGGCDNLQKIYLPEDIPATFDIPTPNGKLFNAFTSSNTAIEGFENIDKLYANGTNNAEYIEDAPILVCTNSGIDYYNRDVEEYSYTIGDFTFTGTTKWDITKEGSEKKIYAYVFHKKQSSEVGDIDSSDNYLLVFSGEGQSKTFSLAYDDVNSRFVGSGQTFDTTINQANIDRCTPWTLAGYANKITAGIISKEVNSECIDFWFADLRNLTDLTISKKNTSTYKTPVTMISFLEGTKFNGLFNTLNAFNLSNTTSMAYAFAYTKIVSIDSTNWSKLSGLTNLESMEGLFAGTPLETFTISSLNLSNVKNISKMFANCSTFKTVSLNGVVTSSNLEDISGMFENCTKLTTLTLGDSINTENVKDMSNLFKGDSKLTTINYGTGFTLNNVENVSGMFEGTSLASYDLTSLGSPNKITSASSMFKGITVPNNIIDISNFDLSNIHSNANANEMFASENIQTIYLPEAVPSSPVQIDLPAKDVFQVFNTDEDAIYQTDYLVAKGGTDNASYVSSYSNRLLFTDDTGIEYYEHDLFEYNTTYGTYNYTGKASWDISAEGNKSIKAYVFRKKKSSAENDWANTEEYILVFSGAGTKSKKFTYALDEVTSEIKYKVLWIEKTAFTTFDQSSYIAEDKIALITPWTFYIDKNNIPITKAYVDKNVNCDLWDGWFADLTNLTEVKVLLDENNKKMPVSMNSTFSKTSVTDFNQIMTNIDTTNTVNMNSCFYDSKLTSFPWDKLETDNLKDVYAMFESSDLTSIDLSEVELDLTKVSDFTNIFRTCASLSSADLTGLKTSTTLTKMDYMFYNNKQLESIIFGDNFVTSNVTSMQYLFSNCYALNSITYGAGFKLENLQTATEMFAFCRKLTNIDLTSCATVIKPTNIKKMFSGISSGNVTINLSNFEFDNVTSANADSFLQNSTCVRKIILPKKLPEFDIKLPNMSYYMFDSNDQMIYKSFETDKDIGRVTKLYTMGGTDDYYSVHLPSDEQKFLYLINTATNDADIKTVLATNMPTKSLPYLYYFEDDHAMYNLYKNLSDDSKNIVCNYIWNKLKDKRSESENYTLLSDLFDDITYAANNLSVTLSPATLNVGYKEKGSYTIGGACLSNIDKFYVQIDDGLYEEVSFGNNDTKEILENSTYKFYRTYKDSALLGSQKYLIGSLNVYVIPNETYILEQINGASDFNGTGMVLTTPGVCDILNSYVDTSFTGELTTSDEYFKIFLSSEFLYTEKEKHHYTSVEDVAKDVKAAFSYNPVLTINGNSTSSNVLNGGDATFVVSSSNSDSRLDDLLEYSYSKGNEKVNNNDIWDIESMGAPYKNFVKVDNLCDANYDVYANVKTIGSDNELTAALYSVNYIPKDEIIIKNGTVINSDDKPYSLTFYYYWSGQNSHYYQHKKSLSGENIIYNSKAGITDIVQDLNIDPSGTTSITNSSQINNVFVANGQLDDTTDQMSIFAIFAYQQDAKWGSYKTKNDTLFGSNKGEPPEGDSRLYVKVPKTFTTLKFETIDGWTGASKSLTGIDSSYSGKYSAEVSFKNPTLKAFIESAKASDANPFGDSFGILKSNKVTLNVANPTLVDSDFTFSETKTFVYDGNAHYITETINPAYSFVTYTKTYTTESGTEINPEDIKDVGTYYLNINVTSPTGDGSKTSWQVPFTITKKSMDDLTFDPATIDDKEYTGQGIDPSSDIHLKSGTDEVDPSNYDITYKDSDGNVIQGLPTEPGDYTAVITGKGNYEGTKEIPFEIVKKQVTISNTILDTNPNLVLEKIYDGLDSYSFETTINIEGNDVPLNVNVKFNNKNVGQNKEVTITLGFKNSKDGNYYELSSNTITKTNGKITKRKLNYAASVDSKVFDGTADVAAGEIHYTLSNVANGDEGKVALNLTAAYASSAAGENKEINLTVAGIIGDESGNYEADNLTINTGKIERREIKYTISVANKKFDNSDDATSVVTLTPDTSTIFTSVNLEIDSAKFASKDFGEHAVNVVLKITGTDPDDYFVIQPTNLKAKITKETIDLTFTVTSKAYDGNTDASSCVSISAVKTSDGTDVKASVPVKITKATFDDKNVKAGKTITIIPEFENTSDKENFEFVTSSFEVTNGEITAKPLTASAVVASKVYDATTNITPNDITVTSSDILTGDDVTFTKSGSYTSKAVGTGKEIILTISLSGSDAGNYSLQNPSQTINTGEITARKLEYTLSIPNKEYDGNTTISGATATVTSGIQGSDNVSLKVTSANFKTPDLGDNKEVDVTLELDGTDKENYTFDAPTNAKANITLKIVKLEFSSSTSKVYDRTTNAKDFVTISKITDKDGTVLTDVPVEIDSATFDNFNAGTGKTITVIPKFTNEQDRLNFSFEKNTYELNDGQITPKTLTYEVSVNEKTYDGTKTATGVAVRNSFTGLISGDNPTITLSNGEFASKDASDAVTATFDAAIDNSNYSITPTISGTGKIKKKNLHIDATTDNGDYNIGDPITVHFAVRESDLVTGESVGLSTNAGSGVVEQEGERKVKKVTIDTWPNLTGSSSVTKNYNEVHSDCFVNLTRLDLTNERLEITIVTRDYFDGTPKDVQVSIRFPELGLTLREGTDFTFEYLDDHTDIGTHDIKITFIGEYKGEKTSSFEIKEKPQPAPSGGSGGGGVTTGGVTYTLLPEEKGLHKAFMKGFVDKTFRPQNAITREEVATIVARLDSEFNEDFNFTSFNTFTDSNDKWSKNYIGFCKLKDLVHGYEDGTFKPANNMTRAELATLVNNFLRIQNADFEDVDLTKAAFSDVDGRWYEESVNKLAALGILNGYEDGTFKGDQPVTRIEVAIVMNKINHRTVTVDVPKEYVKKITSAFKDITADRWFFKDVAESVIDHPADLY